MDIVREIALKALYKIDKEDAYSNIALDETIKKNRRKLDDRDVGFISEIVYGVITWRLTIDEIIKKYSNIRLKKISPWILNILRMGIYQIIFLDKVPKSAAVNESVNLCKKYNYKSANFVNAILRKIEKSDYQNIDDIKEINKRISLKTSMPEWFVDKLINEYGAKEALEICNDLNLRPNNTVRVNRLKKNIEIGIPAILDDFRTITGTKNIVKMPEYINGNISIQDESAGLSSFILNPKEGETVLDACSAPGGKTTYLAEIMNNTGSIVAWDIYEERLKQVDENAKRLGINIIKTEVKDASIYDKAYDKKFNKILLDVPCLGLGVIRRKPDIKWNRNEENIDEITKIQYQILKTCSKYLKDDGILVYSTCSILKEENINIIEKFLEEEEFEIVDISDKVKKDFKYVNEKNTIELFPNEKHDGFYIACLKRK